MKKTYHLFWFLITDFTGAFIAWLCFFYLRKYVLDEDPESILQPFVFISAGVIASFWVVNYFFAGLYRDLYRRSRTKDAFLLFALNFLGAVIVFFVLLLDDEGVREYTAYYKTFSLYYILHTVFSIQARFIVITIIKKLIRSGKLVFNTVIVGANKKALEIFDEIKVNQKLGYKFIGFLQVFEGNNNLLEGKLRSFGSYLFLPKVIRRCYVDYVVIAIEASEHKKIQEILNMLQGYNVKVSIIPDIHQILLGSVKANQLLDIPLIEINQDLIPQWQKVLKRGIDIFAALAVLILGAPFFAIMALMTKVTSCGPVFYTQERIGIDGKPFKIIKYRSMYVDAEPKGPALASNCDNRITTWGKLMRRFRLDEFPQFYNVLVGDMSLVGPRPERQFYIDQIICVAPEYRHLLKVRPGLTSLGQVKFGYAENLEEMIKRLKYDIFYIENMSLAMDFRIMLYTVLIIIQGRGK